MDQQFPKDDMLRGQSEVWRLMFAFSHSMALKCAVELRILDIIHSYDGPMTLAFHIGSNAAGTTRLERIMLLLVHEKVFAAYNQPNGGETLYRLTPISSEIGMDQFTKEEMLQGQSEAWTLMYAFSHSMALRCAVDLHIPDIIHSHGGPMTLPHMVSKIGSQGADATRLERIMRLLVRKKVFTAHKMANGGETLYGLTPTSSWFLHGSELSLAPMILFNGHEISAKPWRYLSEYVREGDSCFKTANDGHDLWESTSKDPEFSKAFNDGMACTAKIMIKAIIEECKHVFEPISSLVDVGGGTGTALAEIVKVYPHITGINFDQPHVVAKAKKYDGVSHVGGNFFEAIPAADAVFMKWILHDWEDDDCVRILKNCRKAIPEGNGKVILSEIVVDPKGDGLFNEMGIISDLIMMTHTDGKERTEPEWRSLLERGGFPRCNVLKIPGLFAVIEGFPIQD